MTPPPPAETAPPPVVTPDAERGAERVNLYVPRILQQHLVDHPESRGWTVEGTAAFVDISGFTKLSEQLARKGKEGAEQITEVIGKSFESILQVAYDRGGSLLKFGGDALLLWFEGDSHVERACHATLMMRAVLDDVGRIKLPDAEVTLMMSQGVHSGEFHFFAVGASHTELLPTGPGWSRLVAMEQKASAGEILLSTETAERRVIDRPRQAIEAYYDHLSDRGALVIIRWPTDIPRLVANSFALLITAVVADDTMSSGKIFGRSI